MPEDPVSTDALLRLQAQELARLVQQPDPHDVDLEPTARDAGQAVQHLREIQGRREQATGLGEHLQFPSVEIVHDPARQM